MTCNWEPGTQYDYNSVVVYNGHKYKIIQPHRSQGDWTPDVTPALWGRMQDDPCDDKQEHYHHETHAPAPAPAPAPTYGEHGQQGQQGQSADNGEKEEKEQHWWQKEEHKKQLGIGGGLLAGALVAGAGYAAYKHHDKKKRQNMDRGEWLEEANERTQAYNSGKGGPVTWVLTSGRSIPRGAIEGGRDEHGEVLYVARAFLEGGIQVGKACTVSKKGAVIGYKHKANDLEEYEILVGQGNAILWVDSQELGRPGAPHPIEGGHEDNGSPLYIAQAQYAGGYQVGKSGGDFDGAFITHGGKEIKVEKYSVLCHAQ